MARPTANLAKQIESLRLYIRTLHSDCRRSSKELDARWGRRTNFPFEDHLLYKRYHDAHDLKMLAEKCLEDLRKAAALRVAAFQPGAQIIATLTVRGYPETSTRHAVWDIDYHKRAGYCYVLMRITKAGTLTKTYRLDSFPANNRHSSRVCTEPVDADTTRTLEWRREVAKKFLEDTVDRGDLDLYEIKEYGYLSSRRVERKQN